MLIHDEILGALIFVSARQHMFISDNSPVRKNYFDYNIILNGSASIVRRLQMDSVEADVAKS